MVPSNTVHRVPGPLTGMGDLGVGAAVYTFVLVIIICCCLNVIVLPYC